MIELSWRAGLAPAEVDEARAFAAAVARADGPEPFSEDALLHLADPGTAQLLARDHGALGGFARLDRDGPAAEFAVHPDDRRAGLGARIAGELLDRTGGTLRVWAHGEHPGAVALAARLGLRKVRELWQMRRDLGEPFPEPGFPD